MPPEPTEALYFFSPVFQSFITATPKSGHVVRHQARSQQVQRSGPVKAKGPAGQKKRVAGTESSEPGEPVEKRGKDVPSCLAKIYILSQRNSTAIATYHRGML